MLNYDSWKKLNENLGLTGGVFFGSHQNMGLTGNPFINQVNEEEEVEEEEIEDEDMEDEDEDEVDEIDMEDAEEDEDAEEEEEDAEEEDAEEKKDHEMASKDEESDMKSHMKKCWSGMGDEAMKSDKPMNMEKDGKEHMKKCWSKCGSYMASESTMPKHIPSMDEWQKSVSKMLDSSCVTKKNFDGVVINEAFGGGIDLPLKNFLAKLDKSNLTPSNLKKLATTIIGALHDAFTDKIPDNVGKTKLMKDIRAAFSTAAEEAEKAEVEKEEKKK